MISKWLTTNRALVTCDHCGDRFERARSQIKEHCFCSRKCSNRSKTSGGVLHRHFVELSREKFGVDNPFASKDVQKKLRDTLLRRHGVDNPQKSLGIREKTRETCIKRYGVDNPAKSDAVKQRTQATMQSRSITVRQGINKKREFTNTERYGVPFQMQREDVKARFDFVGVAEKSHVTKVKNGRFGNVSIVEREFLECLKREFGTHDIDHQTCVGGWSIDFYIRSLDTFVQFDGVYWHGLDRPLELIRCGRSSKDASIYKKFLRDRKQDRWFEQNGLTLVRITDKEFGEWQQRRRTTKTIKRLLLEKTMTSLQT